MAKFFNDTRPSRVVGSFQSPNRALETYTWLQRRKPAAWAQAYYILDELFIAGELGETSKKEVLSVCAQMDEMMDDGSASRAHTRKFR